MDESFYDIANKLITKPIQVLIILFFLIVSYIPIEKFIIWILKNLQIVIDRFKFNLFRTPQFLIRFFQSRLWNNRLKRYLNADNLPFALFIGILLIVFTRTLIQSVFENITNFLIKFQPNHEFLSDAIGIEVVLIAVSIPISLNVVAWAADRLNDAELSIFFIKEPLYRVLFFLLTTNLIAMLFLKFSGGRSPLLLWLMLLWTVINIIIFYKSIRLVERYFSKMDDIILEKLGKSLDELLKK